MPTNTGRPWDPKRALPHATLGCQCRLQHTLESHIANSETSEFLACVSEVLETVHQPDHCIESSATRSS